MQAHHYAHGAGIAAPETLHADHDDLASLGAAAAAAGGLSPAPNDDAQTGTNGMGAKEHGTTDSPDSAATHIAEQDKALSTARAMLALAGWTLHIVDGGGAAAYWVSRWGQSRTLPDRHALAHFMKQVGCKP